MTWLRLAPWWRKKDAKMYSSSVTVLTMMLGLISECMPLEMEARSRQEIQDMLSKHREQIRQHEQKAENDRELQRKKEREGADTYQNLLKQEKVHNLP